MREDVPALIRRIAWRAIHDDGGDEVASLAETAGGWRLRGDAETSFEGRPVRIEWTVDTDAGWHTRRVVVRVRRSAGRELLAERELRLDSDGRGHWTLDGAAFAEADGCVDVDLGWTPATNTLPIRRLGLSPGESGPTRVVWVVDAGLGLEIAEQHYECLGEGRFRYSSGAFSAVLTVDDEGLVTDYEGLFRAVPLPTVRRAVGP